MRAVVGDSVHVEKQSNNNKKINGIFKKQWILLYSVYKSQ